MTDSHKSLFHSHLSQALSLSSKIPDFNSLSTIYSRSKFEDHPNLEDLRIQDHSWIAEDLTNPSTPISGKDSNVFTSNFHFSIIALFIEFLMVKF